MHAHKSPHLLLLTCETVDDAKLIVPHAEIIYFFIK